MNAQHGDFDTVGQLVEQLEILGIKPDRVADRASLMRLIATWGVACPGGGMVANRAREIIARAGGDDELVAKTKVLMQMRAAERAAARHSAQAVRMGNA